MDISRLPTAPVVQPASAPRPNMHRASSAATGHVVESADSRPATRVSSATTVQGELLHRDRGQYQSTRSFLDERALVRARPARSAPVPLDSPRAALSRYQQNIRPESLAEMTRGQAVNLVV